MRVLAVLLVTAPLVLVACGGGGSKSSQTQLTPVASIRHAALKTSQASSEHMSLNATATVQGQKVVMTGDGSFDNAKKQGDLQLHANVGGLDVPIESIVDGTNLYLKSAIFQATLPASKTWIRLDLAKAGKQSGVDLSTLLNQDPTQQLQQLSAAGGVTDVGAETIGGASVEHYRVTIDKAKLPAGVRKAAAGVKYAPEDVYVGKDDSYVHRVRASWTAQKQTITTTMNFSDFGKDVTVAIPPASQTVDETNKSLSGLGG